MLQGNDRVNVHLDTGTENIVNATTSNITNNPANSGPNFHTGTVPGGDASNGVNASGLDEIAKKIIGFDFDF
jgi:hypothetical protein